MTTTKNIILLLLFSYTSLLASNNDNERYIDTYKYIAVSEMERTGIPASIKLAQGLLESGAGKSTLAQKAKNHFGIKCGSSWNGKKRYQKDDDYKKGKLIKSCFRAYRKPEDSYFDHSYFLLENSRYRDLFKIDPLKYKKWAKGLKKAGYATSKTYDKKLIKIIEKYELYRYDQMASSDQLAKADSNTKIKSYTKKTSEIFYINDAKALLAKAGDTPRSIAERTHTSLKRILAYNEELKIGSQSLKKEEKVFIQKKRRNFRGKKRTHEVQEGETMYDISQEYGLRLEKLYKKNKMIFGAQPATGEQIQVRGKGKKRPLLKSETSISKPTPVLIDEAPINVETELEIENSPYIEFEEEEEPIIEEEPIFEPSIVKEERKKPADEKIQPENQTPPYLSDPVERPQHYHVVKKGETLWRISKNYSMTVDALKQLNNLHSNIISIGMRLQVE